MTLLILLVHLFGNSAQINIYEARTDRDGFACYIRVNEDSTYVIGFFSSNWLIKVGDLLEYDSGHLYMGYNQDILASKKRNSLSRQYDEISKVRRAIGKRQIEVKLLDSTSVDRKVVSLLLSKPSQGFRNTERKEGAGAFVSFLVVFFAFWRLATCF